MKCNHYEDILHMTYPFPMSRKRMSTTERAAQFSPFAALVGYDDVIEETARMTGHKIELDENEKALLDRKQQILLYCPRKQKVAVTFFRPDEKKDGGDYITVTDTLKNISQHSGTLQLDNGQVIPLADVIALEIVEKSASNA